MPENRLIAGLPRADRVRLLAVCRPLAVAAGEVLCEAGAPMRHVYFPIDCVLALMARVADHPAMALALVGSESMLGLHAVLWPAAPGAASAAAIAVALAAPMGAQVQMAGQAWQVASADFVPLVAGSAVLRRELGRRWTQLLDSVSGAAACAHFHQIGPRLARWLLLSQDRAQADSFQLTHARLALLLGVRRVDVTVAAGVLQRSGLIGYRRGRLSVLDRPGLEAAACSCRVADLHGAAPASGAVGP